MSDEHEEASELDEAEEVFDVIFPASDESAIAVQRSSILFSRPRSCKWPASRRKISTSLPPRIHCWKCRWQVWYGGYLAGISNHCAPLPSIQNTPWSTARVSCHGRPGVSARRLGRSTGFTNSHSSSVSSQRSAITVRRDALSNFSLADHSSQRPGLVPSLQSQGTAILNPR